MANVKLVNFDSKSIYEEMLTNIAKEQCLALAVYAEKKIKEIGAKINTYNSKNHMDRTGNLLDSLVWGVSYDGKLTHSGFYREAQASEESYLHEWFSGDVKYLIPVKGRELASDYLEKYGNNGAKGFRVFFAILAPYWGYWEKGFRMTRPTAPINSSGKTSQAYIKGTRSFYQFSVMTEFYDEVKRELKPARVRFRTSVAKYSREKLEKRWEKYAGL